MWHLKFRAKHSDCIYAPKIIELGINTFFYPSSHHVKNKFIFSSLIQIVEGNEKQIKAYTKYLKNHKLILKVERKDNVIISLSKQDTKKKEYTALYNPELLYISPGHYDKEGFEVWEIACWNRNVLETVVKLIKNAKNTTYFKILKFKKEPVKKIYLPKLFSRLSKKQEKVFNLAIKEGYYTVPRQTTLDRLAEIMKISKSTLQEHLRKAEAKIIPFLK